MSTDQILGKHPPPRSYTAEELECETKFDRRTIADFRQQSFLHVIGNGSAVKLRLALQLLGGVAARRRAFAQDLICAHGVGSVLKCPLTENHPSGAPMRRITPRSLGLGAGSRMLH